MGPITRVLKEARWSILEKQKSVTRFTQQTADITDSPKVPPAIRRLLKNPDMMNLKDEFYSARL